MSIGSMLVAAAVALVAITYIALPFRRDTSGYVSDATLESWIELYSHSLTPTPSRASTPPLFHASTPSLPTHFCPQCGRSVEPDHRFCPTCGVRLPGTEAVE